MTQFLQEIQIRIESAKLSLVQAETDGDPYEITVRQGEVESLERLAADHAC